MPVIQADFAGVIRGKKTIASLHDAVDTELARAKIEANAIADRIEINLNSLRDMAKDHAFLFADIAQIVQKENDDLVALIKVRIADHAAAEQKRLDGERERIRAEEQAKLVPENKASQAIATVAATARGPLASPAIELTEARAMLADFVQRYGHIKEFATVVSLIKVLQRRAA